MLNWQEIINMGSLWSDQHLTFNHLQHKIYHWNKNINQFMRHSYFKSSVFGPQFGSDDAQFTFKSTKQWLGSLLSHCKWLCAYNYIFIFLISRFKMKYFIAVSRKSIGIWFDELTQNKNNKNPISHTVTFGHKNKLIIIIINNKQNCAVRYTTICKLWTQNLL